MKYEYKCKLPSIVKFIYVSWKFSEQHITKILLDFKLIISVYHLSFFEEAKIIMNLISNR